MRRFQGSQCKTSFQETYTTKYSVKLHMNKKMNLFMLLSLILMIINVQAQQCGTRPFPKAIGGKTKTTDFWQMDFNDVVNKIAAVGYTNQQELGGLSGYAATSGSDRFPVIAVYSTITFNREWIKIVEAFRQTFSQVAFSSDGQYIIAATAYQKLWIFSISGTLITAREDPANYVNCLNSMMRTMIIDSKNPRSLYILVHYRIDYTGGSNFGYRIAKYQADTNTVPIFYKYSKNSYVNGDFGYSITFGESEDFIYIYSKYTTANEFVISRVSSSDATVFWNYGYTYSAAASQSDFTFHFRNMGSGTEVIGVSSGTSTGTTKYGRLVISNGVVVSGDLFTEPTNYNHAIRALKVVNQEQFIVATITTNTYESYIETLTFGTTLTQSIKKTIPKFTSPYSSCGRFISDTNYIGIACSGSLIMNYQLQTSVLVANGIAQGIIFSLESSSTCQTFSQEAPVVRTLSKTAGGIFDKTLTYQIFMDTPLAPVTLNTISSASSLVHDYVQSQMGESIDYFCTNRQYTFTVPTGTLTFDFQAGNAKSFTISPISVSACTTVDPSTVIYTMLMSDLTIIDPLLFTFDSSTRIFSVSNLALKRTYYFTMKISLIDSTQYVTQNMNFQGTNVAPTMTGATTSSSFATYSVPINSIQSYIIPNAIIDTEGNTITITSLYSSSQIVLPTWIKFESATMKFTFSPSQFAEVKTHSIYLKIEDPYGYNTYFFNLIVTNTAPVFVPAELVNQIAYLSQTIEYQPITSDAEGNAITFTTGALPSYVTFQTEKFIISPTLVNQFGTVTISAILSDTLLSTTKTFTITIPANYPPLFSSSLVAQTVALNSIQLYSLPSYSDPEGLTVIASVISVNTVAIQLTSNQLKFSPTDFAQIGDHTVSIQLSDGIIKDISSFILTVTNSAPYFDTALADQTVTLFISKTYQTSAKDSESNAIIYSTGVLPSFITFSNGLYTFNPTLQTQLGTHSLSLAISDSQLSSSQSFTLTVIANLAPLFSNVLVGQTVALKSILNYQIPAYSDPEGKVVTASSSINIPGMITFANNIFTFSPTDFTHTGVYTIDVTLDDGNVKGIYPFTITITNSAPTIKATIDQLIGLSSTNTYTLTDFSDAEGHPITITAVENLKTVLPTFIIFTQPTFTISPTLIAQVGSYTIDINLSDGQLSSTASFIVTVTNQSPEFSKAPVNQNVHVNKVSSYTLTDFVDAEGNFVTIRTNEQGQTLLPSFITFSQPTFTMTPTDFTQLGSKTLEIYLTDGGHESKAYLLIVTVINTAPKFTSALPVDQFVALNSINSYQLPAFIDAEGHQITIKIISTGPSFASVEAGGVIKFAPTQFTDVKTHNIDIVMYDEQPIASPTYSFKVTVTNTAPKFDSAGLINQVIPFNNILKYQLPAYSDSENTAITVSLNTTNPFVTLSSDQKYMTFNLLDYSYIGAQQLKLTFSDTQFITEYQFKVSFTNTAPVFPNEKPQNQIVCLNEERYYQMPTILEPEGSQYFINIVTKATFITLSNEIIKINPTQFSYLGVHLVTIEISDGQPLTSYYNFTVTVTNTAPKFMGALPADQQLHLNEVIQYDLPAFSDNENNEVTIDNKMPPFVEFNSLRYIISPTLISHIGTFTISGALKDEVSQTKFSFDIKVLNDQPYFASDPVDQTVNVGETITYQLPSAEDKELLPVKVTLGLNGQKPLPGFMKFTGNVLEVSPTSNFLHSGTYTLQATLTDGQALPKFYQFKIKSNKVQNDKNTNSKSQVVTKSAKTSENFLNSLKKVSENGKQPEIFKATIKLLQATRDGQLKIKILSSQDVSGICKKIESGDIQLKLISQGNLVVNFTINSKDLGTGQLKISLKFINPAEISSSTSFKAIKLQYCQQFKHQDCQFLHNFHLVIYSQMMNIIATAKLAESLKAGSDIAAVVALPGGFIINLTLSMCIQYLWGMLNDLSFLTILTMMSVTLPGIAQIIQQAMLNFIYLDLLMTDKWLVPLFFSDSNTDDQGVPLNQQFDDNGFNSTILIKNLGSTFVYLLMLIVSYPIYYIMGLFSKYSQRIRNQKEKLGGHLFWNTPIRFIIQQFPPLFLASLVNLYGMSFNTLGTMISSIMALIIVVVSPICIIFIARIIYLGRKRGILSGNEHYNSKFGTVTEGLNTKAGFLAAYWNIIVLLRWSVTSIIMVTVRENPEFQIISMLTMSIFQQLLIFAGKPMNGPGENRMSFLNELMVSIYLYIALSLTDFYGTNTLREECGWALAGVVVLSSIMNLLKFKITISKLGIKSCKLRRLKKEYAKKLEVHQKYLEASKLEREKEQLEQENLRLQLEKEVIAFEQKHGTAISRARMAHYKSAQNRKLLPRDYNNEDQFALTIDNLTNYNEKDSQSISTVLRQGNQPMMVVNSIRELPS